MCASTALLLLDSYESCLFIRQKCDCVQITGKISFAAVMCSTHPAFGYPFSLFEPKIREKTACSVETFN